jgi:hypothetical protein
MNNAERFHLAFRALARLRLSVLQENASALFASERFAVNELK